MNKQLEEKTKEEFARKRYWFSWKKFSNNNKTISDAIEDFIVILNKIDKEVYE